MDKVEQVGKQLNEVLQQEFCAKKVDPSQFAPISKRILSKLMNESFLGANPPDDWEALTNDIINNCLQNKDLCKKEVRQEFEECLKPRIPLILVQYGPWVADNCTQLNRTLIQGWPNKKEALLKAINESKSQLNPAST